MAQYEWCAFRFTRTCWSMFQNPVLPWKFQNTAIFAFWCWAACAGVMPATSTAAATTNITPVRRKMVCSINNLASDSELIIGDVEPVQRATPGLRRGVRVEAGAGVVEEGVVGQGEREELVFLPGRI